jgi:hypothetical protein
MRHKKFEVSAKKMENGGRLTNLPWIKLHGWQPERAEQGLRPR